MKCEKCQDRGFIEENHGLIVILCDCEKGKEYRARQEAILGIPKANGDDLSQPQNGDDLEHSNDNGTIPDNTDIESSPKIRRRGKRRVKKSA